MSKRTKFLLGIVVIAALVIGWQVAAFAVHDEGVFELEGNAVTNHTTAGLPDDWDRICKEATKDLATPLCTSATIGATSADEVAFVAEPNPQASFFTGGGSKDPEDIPAWKWKNDVGGLPDKSNIRDSYAASYTATNGDELLYFGADRFDGSGDAAIAFWFLQDEVAQIPPNASSGTFDGVHTEGDVLVISNFSNGGSVSTITVYKWDAPGAPTPNDPGCTKADNNNPQAGDCAAANLRVVTTSTNADCGSASLPAGDDACAIVNNAQDAPNTAPWPFTDKSGSTTFLPGEFFEGGINLTDLGLGGECFASTLAETRTSTSPTSVLKDFTIGPFGDCEAGVETQASKADGSAAGTVTPGTPVHDIATITGSGTTPLIDPTGTVDFFLCGPLAATDEGCPTGGTAAGTDVAVVGGSNTTDGISTANSADVNTAGSPLAPGRYCFRAEYSGDDNYDPDSETNNTTECFTVSQPTTITTTQKWLPQDTATVTPAGTAGTVEFSLYENGTCSGTPARTFQDSSPTNGVFETDNSTYRTATTTISWSATFDPSGNEDPSTTTRCERSELTINNSASDFPPPQTP